MTTALTTGVAAFALGLCAIDWNCDNYSLIGSGPTSAQRQTCVAYYANFQNQPLYVEAPVTIMIVVGFLALLARLANQRTIYDYFTVPCFFVPVTLFLAVIIPAREKLASTSSLKHSQQLEYLHTIALSHAVCVIGLVGVFIFQTLAASPRAREIIKKNM